MLKAIKITRTLNNKASKYFNNFSFSKRLTLKTLSNVFCYPNRIILRPSSQMFIMLGETASKKN